MSASGPGPAPAIDYGPAADPHAAFGEPRAYCDFYRVAPSDEDLVALCRA